MAQVPVIGARTRLFLNTFESSIADEIPVNYTHEGLESGVGNAIVQLILKATC